MTTTKLHIELNSLPIKARKEVEDFVEILKKENKTESLKEREFGFAKGKISLAEDFDEPLDQFKDYM